MKEYLFSIFLFLSITCYAQKIDYVKKPELDSSLVIGDRLNFYTPLYLVDDDKIIYQKDRRTIKLIASGGKSLVKPENGQADFFALNKDGVFIDGNFVKTDTLGFENLGRTLDGGFFWKTHKAVYKNLTVINNLDASEFQRIRNPKGFSYITFFKDKYYIYYYDKIIKGVDPDSAVFTDSDLCYDKNSIYIKGEKQFFNSEPLQYVNNYFSKTKDHIISQNKIDSRIDKDSFISLSNFYSRDKDHVYSEYETMPIHAADFVNLKTWKGTNSAYITDGKRLFFKNIDITENNLDISSFGTIENSDFCYDKNGVYSWGFDHKINKLVFYKFPFKYSDPVSSKNIMISEKNNMYVFYKNQAYNLSDGLFENLTAEQIENAKTQRQHLININGSVKLKTFYNYSLSKVDDKIYWENKETFADAKTFERVKDVPEYYKDKNYVYHFSSKSGLNAIKGIDANSAVGYYSFQGFDLFLSDKDYIYFKNYRILRNKNLKLLSVFEGSWPQCGVDNSGSSTYYLFKNSEGYWLALVSKTVKIKKISEKDPFLKKYLGIKVQ